MSQPDLATLCACHLGEEETLLAAVLPILRAVKEGFLQRGFGALETQVQRQQDVSGLIDTMRGRRDRLRAELARRLDVAPDEATLSRVLASLPESIQDSLHAGVERVRRMANELVTLNHWLAVHLRIHLDAYQRLLAELTGAGPGSGRYGPAGKTETHEYPPLIQIHG